MSAICRRPQTEEEREIPRWRTGDGKGRQVVARPRDRRRRIPGVPDERRLADQAGAVSLSSTNYTVRVDFAKKDRLTIPDLAVIVPCVVNFRTSQEECQRERSLGPRICQAADRRFRRLQGDEMDGRHRKW